MKGHFRMTRWQVFILTVFLMILTSEVIRPADLRPPIPERYRGLKNPLAQGEKNLQSGEWLYDIHCSACHGGNLEGNGPEAGGFLPPPANLIALITAVKPPESYLFWRIREGGPGLPEAWKPWNSAMPVWKEELTDDDIWRIILYVYEAAGEGPSPHE